MVSKDWVLDDVSGVFGRSDIGHKLAVVVRQAKAVGAKDKENTISTIGLAQWICGTLSHLS